MREKRSNIRGPAAPSAETSAHLLRPLMFEIGLEIGFETVSSLRATDRASRWNCGKSKSGWKRTAETETRISILRLGAVPSVVKRESSVGRKKNSTALAAKRGRCKTRTRHRVPSLETHIGSNRVWPRRRRAKRRRGRRRADGSRRRSVCPSPRSPPSPRRSPIFFLFSSLCFLFVLRKPRSQRRVGRFVTRYVSSPILDDGECHGTPRIVRIG